MIACRTATITAISEKRMAKSYANQPSARDTGGSDNDHNDNGDDDHGVDNVY